MSDTVNTAPTGGFTQVMRIALIGVAIVFLIGGVVQFFLAGLSVFDAEPWDNHVDFGRMLGFLAYLMPILALLGRVGMPRIGHAFVVTILFIVQSFLANVDTGWIAAFHPLNGLLLLGAASSLAARIRELVQSDRGGARSAATP
ncbi:MAG: DUF6220 domain-containing protein [Thermomicrobiales bacterium]